MTAALVCAGRHASPTPAAFIDKAREHWCERIPSESFELLGWCLKQDADTLRGLLAFCVAQTVNAVKLKHDPADSDRLMNADELAATLKLDMAAWFTPTAGNYFGGISKAAIVDVLREIKGQRRAGMERHEESRPRSARRTRGSRHGMAAVPAPRSGENAHDC